MPIAVPMASPNCILRICIPDIGYMEADIMKIEFEDQRFGFGAAGEDSDSELQWYRKKIILIGAMSCVPIP